MRRPDPLPRAVDLLTLAALLMLVTTAAPISSSSAAYSRLSRDLSGAAAHARINENAANKLMNEVGEVTHPLVVLVTVSTADLDFFRNWLYYYRRTAVGLYIVIAEDKSVYDILYNDPSLNLKGRVVNADLSSQGARHGNMRDSWSTLDVQKSSNTLDKHRPVFVKILLELGYDVLYTDVDLVWLQDPLQYLDDRDVHIYVQSDPGSKSESSGRMACSGFMMLRNTTLTIQLINRWIDANLNGPGDTSSHETFSRLMLDMHHNHPHGFAHLPWDLFPSADHFFDPAWRKQQTRDPVVIHHAFRDGRAAKKALFKQHGLWHPVK